MNLVVEATHARTGGMLTYTRLLSRLMPGVAGPLTLIAPRAAVAPNAAHGLRHVDCEPGGAIGGIVSAGGLVLRELDAAPEPVLFASANFTIQPRRIPQLLLMRNTIYFDPVYEAHVLRTLPLREQVGVAFRRGLCLASGEAARYVITPTRAMRDLVVAARPSLADKIEAVPYGVETERFRAAAGRRAPSPRGRLRVISHSLIARHKPTWPILEGVERARATGADVTLTLLDSPFGADMDPVPDIEQDRKRAQAGLDAGWLTITGKVPHERIASLLAEHDAFAFHTLCESFGHPYVEAMASGLACVVTDLPIAREVAGEAAIFVPLFDPDAFAAAFVRLADEPAFRAEEGSRAQAHVERAGYSWERHFARVSEILRQLAKGETPQPA